MRHFGVKHNYETSAFYLFSALSIRQIFIFSPKYSGWVTQKPGMSRVSAFKTEMRLLTISTGVVTLYEILGGGDFCR